MTVLGKGCQWGTCCVFTAVCSHLLGIAPCTVLVLGRVGKEESGANNQGGFWHTEPTPGGAVCSALIFWEPVVQTELISSRPLASGFCSLDLNGSFCRASAPEE